MSLKIAAVAGLLNFLQIAVAAAPSQQPVPANPPAQVETANDAALTARSALELAHIASLTATLTGYSSTRRQTDSTPCIAATGINICTANFNAAASNDFPLWTQVMIDGTVYTIVDRMNARYSDNGAIEVDIYFPPIDGDVAAATEAAKNFGRKTNARVFVL